MIKCNASDEKLELEITGRLPDIMNELTLIFKHLREQLTPIMGADGTESFLQEIFRVSKMSDEELKAETELLEKDILRKLFGGPDDGK